MLWFSLTPPPPFFCLLVTFPLRLLQLKLQLVPSWKVLLLLLSASPALGTENNSGALSLAHVSQSQRLPDPED